MTSGCGIIRSIKADGTENTCIEGDLCIVCANAHASNRPVTYVPSEDGYTTITTQVGDTVYALNSRTAQYKHTLHRVRRVDHGLAVTYCTIWLRGGAVMPTEKDCAVWCEYGCKPLPTDDRCQECGLMDVGGGHPAHTPTCTKNRSK